MNKWLCLCAILISNLLHSIDIQLMEKLNIDQGKIILERVCKIAVTEDDYYIFPDCKAGNIKIFNSKGRLARVWGQKGMGPDDFAYPLFCDYKKPYFILIDWGKYKLMLYERIKPLEFKNLRELYVLALGYDIKLFGKDGENVIIAGFKKDINSKKHYELYIKNFFKNEIDFILPEHIKYGCESPKKFDKVYLDKYAPIGLDAYFDYIGHIIYYAWEGHLKIIKINMQTKEMEFFGKKTENYITPKVTPRLRKMQREKSMKMYTERQKMSYVTGIFAIEQFVGLIFTTYDNKREAWKSNVQFYKSNGEFIIEKSLEDSYNSTNYADSTFFYSKAKSILYFLSRSIDKEFNDVFKILKYKVVLQ